LLFDSRNADEVRRVHEAGREIMEACTALGGTITGEHGVGMEKSEALRLVFSEDDLEFQRRLRAAFDPRELLNPAKVLPAAIGSADSARPASPQLPARGDPAGEHHLPGEAEFLPADVGEACEIVRRAGAERQALVPCGNGTQLEFGNCLDRPATPLRSLKLAAVVEHDPANQMVAIGAGMPLDALQDLLAGHGQWLPLRPPLEKKHTVGGIVAVGACGPERLRYGAPRDLLLGLKFVSGTGRLIAAGGRVVKNVAGYDLTRLLAGSAGTLGFLTELTFRVLPLPQSCTAVIASGSFPQCGSAAAVLRSKLEPNFLVAVPEEGTFRDGGDAPWKLLAGFEGFRQTVDFQAESCRGLLEKAGLGRAAARDYPPREGVCQGPFETLYQAPVVLRADLPPDRAAPLVSAHGELLRDWTVLWDLGCGRITAAGPGLPEGAWDAWCGITGKAGGHCLLEKATEPLRRACDVFGPPREDWPLMHRIKAALDPRGVFAPGRMPGRK
jgi:FAD/FMN-containing dehydrogenase